MEQPETMDPEPEPEPEPGLDGESELIIETARREVAAQRNKLLDDALEELEATTSGAYAGPDAQSKLELLQEVEALRQEIDRVRQESHKKSSMNLEDKVEEFLFSTDRAEEVQAQAVHAQQQHYQHTLSSYHPLLQAWSCMRRSSSRAGR